MMVKPATSSLDSANGPSVTTGAAPSREIRTRAPADVGFSPSPVTITPASSICLL